jgi:CLIP-associating protein 1/2
VYGMPLSRPSLKYSSMFTLSSLHVALMPNIQTRTAPSRAKSDLKKQLAEYNVRKSIATAILSSLDLSVHDLPSNSRSESRRPGSSLAVSRTREEAPRPNSVLSTRPESRIEISREGMPHRI